MKNSIKNLSFAIVVYSVLYGCNSQLTEVIPNNLQLPTKSEYSTFTPTVENINYKPETNGIFLIEKGLLLPLIGIWDDSLLDLPSIPETTNRNPVLSIMGSTFQMGNISVYPYIAGIGVNLSYQESGVLVVNVFDESPAKLAGILPGDLILSSDGKPIERELVHTYRQGMDDLIGVMCENISLEILSGTISKTIQLPRTYTKSVNEFVFATKAPHINYQLNPKGDYVIIQITSILEKGIYRVEFPGRIPTITPTGKVVVGPIGNVGPTKTPFEPTSMPTSIVAPIWTFKVAY